MELLEDQIDSLATLEERIHQAIELVTRLRREKDAALAARDAAAREASSAREQAAGLTRELDNLRAERSEVRSRIEKLLGQIDTLGAG
jgi:FtsZ-binding cell division protein ZapB